MIGYYQDKYPRGYVAMRGWDPQNPTKQTIALPVAPKTGDAGAPEWIWPGHVMFPTADGKWTKEVPSKVSIIAVAQDASVDTHVLAARSLVGLACSDSFKLATPFFRQKPANSTPADSYTLGTALTYCASNENVDGITASSGLGRAAGYIKPAGASDTIIGYVCEAPVDPMLIGKNGSLNLQPDFVNATDSMSKKENAYFVIWNTCYQVKA
jgi:hypothetical protein